MALSCPKSTYRVIAVLLTVCLLFALIPQPEAYAIAGVDDAALGIAVIGILANSMGYMFSSHGDFKAACAACWNDLTDNLKDSIIDNVQASGMSLNLTALIASTEFSFIWNFIKDYFSRDAIDIPAVSDTAQLFPSTVNKNNIPVSNSSRLNISFPSGVKYLPNANASYDFTLYNGDVISFRSVYESWSAAGTSRFTLFINDVFQSSYGAAYPSFICPVQYGNSLFICLFSNNHYEYSLGDSIPPIWSGKVSELDWGEDTHIPISNDVSAIPQDAVYDAWKEKSTSAGGITVDEETTIWQEVFGDIAEDVAMIATQVQTLTDTAVLEAVDEQYYTDPMDDTVPRLPFFPADFSGFGSIWHYVEEWLSSIGGFISLILNVWSSLPYIIVVPVYACVVLVLIFGVYRKFIA